MSNVLCWSVTVVAGLEEDDCWAQEGVVDVRCCCGIYRVCVHLLGSQP